MHIALSRGRYLRKRQVGVLFSQLESTDFFAFVFLCGISCEKPSSTTTTTTTVRTTTVLGCRTGMDCRNGMTSTDIYNSGRACEVALMFGCFFTDHSCFRGTCSNSLSCLRPTDCPAPLPWCVGISASPGRCQECTKSQDCPMGRTCVKGRYIFDLDFRQ